MQTGGFASIEEYCLHLIHLKAHEEVAVICRGKIVLDLGCNNGYGTRILASSGRWVVGVDVSEKGIAEARRLANGENLSFICTTGDRLPFDDGEFDIVTSFQVIEHISDYGSYLSEICRVLKPDGIAVFTTPNSRIRLDPGMKPWFPFHIREFSAGDLKDLLRQWFAQVQVRGLFATKELYEIEYNRVQRSRERARLRAKALFPPYTELRTKVIDSAKAVLPDALVRSVQGLFRKFAARQGTQTSGRDAQTVFVQAGLFSTSDLYYAHDNLDEALDLMAICLKSAGK